MPALILALIPPLGISRQLPWLLLGAELGLVADAGRLFLLFTALRWRLAGMYARAHLSGQADRGPPGWDIEETTQENPSWGLPAVDPQPDYHHDQSFSW